MLNLIVIFPSGVVYYKTTGLNFQLSAPEGFSADCSAPALTTPGFAARSIPAYSFPSLPLHCLDVGRDYAIIMVRGQLILWSISQFMRMIMRNIALAAFLWALIRC